MENNDILDEPSEKSHSISSFKTYMISKTTRRKLKKLGYKSLFPVQYHSYNSIYSGLDLLCQARTGTGKTLAFALPLIEKLSNSAIESPKHPIKPLVLVIVPTRELALQVSQIFYDIADDLIITTIYGGVSYDAQIAGIQKGSDIVVGTPGRILDLVKGGKLKLLGVNHVILDEADRLFEQGFSEDIENILNHTCLGEADFDIKSSVKPQFLLFSATVPQWVINMSDRYMTSDYEMLDLIGKERVRTSTTVEHKALKCPFTERASTIADVIKLYVGKNSRVMIFCPTKIIANELASDKCLRQDCQVLHGDIQQKQREITLLGFREGSFNYLISTDIAARGLDIPEVDLVIQFEPPNDFYSYIHRAGRTGRAGRNGISILFYKSSQEWSLKKIESIAGISFQRIGAPQQADLLKSSAQEAIEKINKISAQVKQNFVPYAEKMLENSSAPENLAAALALISGYTEITNRSLLSGMKDYVCFCIEVEFDVRTNSYFWTILNRILDENICDLIKGLRMLANQRGCVFDVHESIKQITITNLSNQKTITFSIPNCLPNLREVTRECSYVNTWKRSLNNKHIDSNKNAKRFCPDYKNNRIKKLDCLEYENKNLYQNGFSQQKNNVSHKNGFVQNKNGYTQSQRKNYIFHENGFSQRKNSVSHKKFGKSSFN